MRRFLSSWRKHAEIATKESAGVEIAAAEHPQARFRDFLRAFWPNWFALMSGGPSVPLAIWAFFVENNTAKIGLWITTAVCALLSAYFVWRPERKSVIDLTEKIRPKLKCTFDRSDSGCVRRNVPLTLSKNFGSLSSVSSSSSSSVAYLSKVTGHMSISRAGASDDISTSRASSSLLVDFYRVKVRADCIGFVAQCSGRVEWVKRDGKIVFDGEKLELTFAPAERPNSLVQDISDQTSEHLDALIITEKNHVFFGVKGIFEYPSSIDILKIFGIPGEYLIHIVVYAPSTASSTIDLLLKWEGHWKTAEVSHSQANI